MQDVTAQDIDRIVGELGRFSSTARGFAQDIDKSRAQSKLENDMRRRDFNNGVANHTKSLVALTGGYKNAATVLASFVGGGLAARAIAGLVSKGSELSKVYQELAASGSTFGGSMLKMQQAAADAGMPLDDFAEATKRSSMVVAQMGRTTWPTFQKNMRDAMIANGNFAMSVEQITEFSGQYLETYRRTGAATKVTGKEMTDLASVTTNLSTATGKAREEITALANSAIEASTAAATIKAMPASMQASATKSMLEVTAVLASQAGEAGSFMTGAFTDTMGKGYAAFTSQGQTLIDVGMGGMMSKFDKLNKNPSIENAVDANNSLLDEIGRNYSSLKNLAAAGNTNAAQMLKVYENGVKLDANKIKQDKLRQDGVTKFFNVIRSMYDQISAKFMQGFLKGFEPFYRAMGDITKSKTMEKFGAMVGTVGLKIGTALSTLFSEENLNKAGGYLQKFGETLASVNWGEVFQGVVWGAQAIGTGFKVLVKVMEHWKETLLVVGAALGGLLAFKALKAADFIKKMFGGKEEIVVKTTRIIMEGGGMGGGNGSGGGGDGDDDGPGGGGSDGSSKRRRGARARAGHAYKKGMREHDRKRGGGYHSPSIRNAIGRHASGMKMASGMMMASLKKGGAKMLTKEALKSGIKKIPIIGALAGLGFAAKRAMSGDVVGAGLELASGAAGTIPGIGTLASVGIDAGLAVRDGMSDDDGGKKKADPSSSTARPSTDAGGGSSKKRALKIAGLAAGAFGLGDIADVLTGGEDAAESGDEDAAADTESKMADLAKQIKELKDAQTNQTDLLARIGSQAANNSRDLIAAVRALKGA
jgi:hypothetical protein